MKKISQRNLIFLVILIALPLLAYGLAFVFLVLILFPLMNSCRSYQLKIKEIIWPLILIVVIGSLSGINLMIKTENVYYYFRDMYYFIQPIMLISVGYYFMRDQRSFKEILRIIVFSAIILSLISYSSFLLNISSGFSFEKRYEYGLSSKYAMIGFMVIYFSKITGFYLFKKSNENILALFFAILVFLSYSRTNIGLLLIFFIIPYAIKIVGSRKQLWFAMSAIFIFIFLGSFLQLTVPDNVATTFVEKVLNSGNEIIIQEYSSMEEINNYWRSYEAFLGFTLYSEGNLFEILFGQGFGAYASAAGIFKSKLQVIPLFHNGFITILLKTGIVGLILFFLLLYKIISTKLFTTNPKELNYFSLLSLGTMWAIIFDTYFTHGLYTPKVSAILLVLLGVVIRKYILVKYR